MPRGFVCLCTFRTVSIIKLTSTDDNEEASKTSAYLPGCVGQTIQSVPHPDVGHINHGMMAKIISHSGKCLTSLLWNFFVSITKCMLSHISNVQGWTRQSYKDQCHCGWSNEKKCIPQTSKIHDMVSLARRQCALMGTAWCRAVGGFWPLWLKSLYAVENRYPKQIEQ